VGPALDRTEGDHEAQDADDQGHGHLVRGQVEAEGQGHYRYSVYAKDVAGNAQANVASNKLKVK
jgi:hypothetical protein